MLSHYEHRNFDTFVALQKWPTRTRCFSVIFNQADVKVILYYWSVKTVKTDLIPPEKHLLLPKMRSWLGLVLTFMTAKVQVFINCSFQL